jgi:hypothetical protein
MAYGPGNLSRPVARQRHELRLTREQVAYRTMPGSHTRVRYLTVRG